MSIADFNRGMDDAYYGFAPDSKGNRDYDSGYRHSERIMEEEEYDRECKKEYEKEMEREMIKTMEEQYWKEQEWEEQNNYNYE